uniref:SIR2 family protein n=1 Tax=Acetatifactor sp. TaxID=1872090 RepID=UPI0040562294
MSITVSEFIEDFANKLSNDQVSLFVGAGVSTEFGLPSWKMLFSDIAKALALDIDAIDDYYQLSQYYCNKYSESDLKRLVALKLQTVETGSKTLDRLLDLDFKSIWTTNFDTAIENCLLSKRTRYYKVHNDKDLSCINTNLMPVLYKINGDINDLENIVLTQSDWENYEYSHPTMLTFLKKELVSNTFLFIGYSFRDHLIKTVLSQIHQFVGKHGIHHYAIFRKESSPSFDYFMRDLEINYNVKPILIDDYSEIPTILSEIYIRTIKRNVFISGRLDDYSDEVEYFANTLLSRLSITLLSNDLNICTGMGRKIGYFVAGPAIQYLLSNGITQLDKRVQVRPFDDNLDANDFTKYREFLIRRNNIVIFVFGQKFIDGTSQNSTGVIEEYEIAKKTGKIIIPIGSTGFAAHQILEDIKREMIRYPYLEPYIDVLAMERDVNVLSKVVLQIIKDVL